MVEIFTLGNKLGVKKTVNDTNSFVSYCAKLVNTANKEMDKREYSLVNFELKDLMPENYSQALIEALSTGEVGSVIVEKCNRELVVREIKVTKKKS